MSRRRLPVGRMVNGIVFGLSTPRRHGNSKSSNFMEEAGLSLKSEAKGKGTTQITGNSAGLIIKDNLP